VVDELLGTILVAIMDAFPPVVLDRKPDSGQPPKRRLEVNWPWVFALLVLFGLLLRRLH